MKCSSKHDIIVIEYLYGPSTKSELGRVTIFHQTQLDLIKGLLSLLFILHNIINNVNTVSKV